MIRKASIDDSQILLDIGRLSFIESHGMSASKEDIDNYVNETYSLQSFLEELSDPENIYHMIFHNKNGKDYPAGFSKIILNKPHPEINIKNISKLERLYLLKEFYGLKLGLQLFEYNVQLSKKHDQSGMWLHVWKENTRAVDFYSKAGFIIKGSHEYRISASHTNPNHLMFLEYQK